MQISCLTRIGLGSMRWRVGAEWPVATELALPSLAERPGSFVVSFSAPIGGRCGQECGIQFGEFAVSFLLHCFI